MFHADLQIGQYILVRRLGKGGFGEVWLAERRSQFFTKKVAVKLPHDEQVDFETIQREAMLWEEASGHPNVLPIIDADIYDGQVVIVSEYADGGSLADKLKIEGRLSLKQAVEMTTGILNGLEFLHNKKIIHRDIKPQNVLLQGDTPRLADFGISRAMNTTTISSVVIGTDAYMAPEAFDGKRNVRTDVWSVGVVLYQLLKGTLPFPQEHPSERMYAVLTKEFEQLPENIPSPLKRIVQKALAKNPDERYQSAAEMKEALRNSLSDSASQQSPANQPTVVLPPSVLQPTIQAAQLAAALADNRSIVTEFSNAPKPTEPAVINSIAPKPAEPAVVNNSIFAQPFVNADRSSNIRKVIAASAALIILGGLLIIGTVAGLFSMPRKSSDMPAAETISNSASAGANDSGAANNSSAMSNYNSIANSSTGYNSYPSTTNTTLAPASNPDTTYSSANTVPSNTNMVPSNIRSDSDDSSGKTESAKTSNPGYSKPPRIVELVPPKPKKTNDPNDERVNVRTTDSPKTTVVTTTRNPDGGKLPNPATVRRGEIPAEVYTEFLKRATRDSQKSENSRKP